MDSPALFIGLAVWAVAAAIVGSMGNDRECGFTLPFLLSLFMSPIMGIGWALNSRHKVDMEYQKRMYDLLKKIAEQTKRENSM